MATILARVRASSPFVINRTGLQTAPRRAFGGGHGPMTRTEMQDCESIDRAEDVPLVRAIAIHLCHPAAS